MSATDVRVTIAGIGGLPRDLALRGRGVRADVDEQAPRSSRVAHALSHLPGGPGPARRDEKAARFPDDAGGIHSSDGARKPGHALSGAGRR